MLIILYEAGLQFYIRPLPTLGHCTAKSTLHGWWCVIDYLYRTVVDHLCVHYFLPTVTMSALASVAYYWSSTSNPNTKSISENTSINTPSSQVSEDRGSGKNSETTTKVSPTTRSVTHDLPRGRASTREVVLMKVGKQNEAKNTVGVVVNDSIHQRQTQPFLHSTQPHQQARLRA